MLVNVVLLKDVKDENPINVGFLQKPILGIQVTDRRFFTFRPVVTRLWR